MIIFQTITHTHYIYRVRCVVCVYAACVEQLLFLPPLFSTWISLIEFSPFQAGELWKTIECMVPMMNSHLLRAYCVFVSFCKIHTHTQLGLTSFSFFVRRLVWLNASLLIKIQKNLICFSLPSCPTTSKSKKIRAKKTKITSH